MRVVVLLSILFVIVAGTWLTEKRMASWERPILVTVYPILADDEAATRSYAASIDEAYFAEVNQFFEHESAVYGFATTPAFRVQVAPVSTEQPPEVPGQFSPLKIAWWSLRMRWWAWLKSVRDDLVQADIQMFVLLHSLNSNSELGISVGMRKGRYGIVKAYARRDMSRRNRVVFTHEMLHVLGATDKYVISTGEPLFPNGFANPEQRPLFPQTMAEIMGGRIPLNSFSSKMPLSLSQCKIGRLTAQEIGFYSQLLD